MDSLKFHSTPRNPAASRRCFVADCSAAFKKSQAIWWPLAETASGHLVVVKSKRHGMAFHPVTAIRGMQFTRLTMPTESRPW